MLGLRKRKNADWHAKIIFYWFDICTKKKRGFNGVMRVKNIIIKGSLLREDNYVYNSSFILFHKIHVVQLCDGSF